jgi:glycosyltransferase involved in cell wall biosynthesis
MYVGRDRLRLEVLRGLTLRSVRTARVTFVFTDYVERLVRSLVPTAKILRIPPGGALDGPPMPIRGSGKSPYVVVLSDLRRYKGIEDAIRAIARPALDDIRVVVCGDAPEPDYRDHLQMIASELGVGSRIEFREPAKRQEVGSLIDEAVCLLQTSRIESLGLPVIEGLSRGAPIVAGDIPVAREVGGDDVAYYRPNDPDDLAARIADALAGQIPTPDAERQRARFSWDHAAAAILKTVSS